MDKKFQETMNYIMSAIKEKGYDPIAQITGFLIYKDSSYITRHKNARGLIEALDLDQLNEYITQIKKHQNI